MRIRMPINNGRELADRSWKQLGSSSLLPQSPGKSCGLLGTLGDSLVFTVI